MENVGSGGTYIHVLLILLIIVSARVCKGLISIIDGQLPVIITKDILT